MMYQDVALAYTCVHASIASQAEFSTPMCEEHLVGTWQERLAGTPVNYYYYCYEEIKPQTLHGVHIHTLQQI